MNRVECYRELAYAFAYPWDREALLRSVRRISGCLDKSGRENPLAGLAKFIAQTDLSGIQEEYVTTFDLSPACAPYVGHHLFGDNHKKGEFMIKVKGIFREHDFHAPEDELPDHLSVLFDFMARLSRTRADVARREFAEIYLLKGMRKMQEIAANKPNMRWKDLINAACSICAADCEEVVLC